jgi:hypothetical protein
MKRQLTDRISVDFGDNNPEWERIRKSLGLYHELDTRGKGWTERLNAELRAAQAKRNQPIEDGYDYNITAEGSRLRLYVWPFTARAIAHEAVNQSMLKMVPIGSIKATKGPDHEVPKELARRSNEAQNADAQGNQIHRLD